MGRIKINDLPEDHKVSKEEMKKVLGGTFVSYRSLIYARPSVSPKLGSIGPISIAIYGSPISITSDIGPISITM